MTVNQLVGQAIVDARQKAVPMSLLWKLLAAWFAISLVVSPIIARRIHWCGSMDGLTEEGS